MNLLTNPTRKKELYDSLANCPFMSKYPVPTC